ncbi:MAG: hypothetical protein LKF74_06960 [Megasphaera sp.]|jgi:hypothetical protein|nr:hypothetical protein [Megasphaera sp.]
MKKLLICVFTFMVMAGSVFAASPDPQQWKWVTSTSADSVYLSKTEPMAQRLGPGAFTASSLFILMHGDNSFTVYQAQIYSNQSQQDSRIRFVTVAHYDKQGKSIDTQSNPDASWNTFEPHSMEANMFYSLCHEVAKYNNSIQVPCASV